MTDPPVLSLERVSRRFGTSTAVDAISFSVARGEFFSLLGPSGCGKTTTLRLIAGFDRPEPDGGTIRILGDMVNDRRPYQRPVGMVFQHYALFPHLSVRRNVAFGLEERRVPRADIDRRVHRALELVRLDPAAFASRRPAELSGGQRQRVALARALVLEPPLLLLDEPLGALDLQLRKEMQLELKALNRTLGTTFVLVTHDQEEALAMSDRIAVMSAGRVEQLGTASDVYQHPRTAFVAGFIGAANLYRGTVAEVSAGVARVVQQNGCEWGVPIVRACTSGEDLVIAVRPEWQHLTTRGGAPSGENSLPGRVRDVLFLGDVLQVLVTLDGGGEARVALRNEGAVMAASWRTGDAVDVCWRPVDGQVLA